MMRNIARRSRGFTLVEMLIVICIIALLMALLVVLIKGSIDRSKNAKSKALIEMLHQGCQAYRTDFGIWPAPFGSSTTLHRTLGSARYMAVGWGPAGATSTSVKPPYIEFKKDMLPVTSTTTAPTPPQILNDAWERVVNYQAGTDHSGTGGANHAPPPGLPPDQCRSPDIWTVGKDPAPAVPEDDIANWVRDY